WEKAATKMNIPTLSPRAQTSPHLLGGILKCGNCGAGMSIGYAGSAKQRYRVYRCSANKNKGTCRSKQFRADEVEITFKQGLAKLFSQSSYEFEVVTHKKVGEEIKLEQEKKIQS